MKANLDYSYPHFHLDIIKKIKSVTYSSQSSHAGRLDYCNCLTNGSTTG